MNSLLFLVARRDSVESQAKIVAVVRKTFGTTIMLHLGLGSVILSLVESVLTGVPQGKIDRRCAHRGDHNSKTNYPHVSHLGHILLKGAQSRVF